MARQFTIKTFDVDQNLMYLIQKVTGQSTNQILSYFYGIASGVAETYLQKKRLANRINKQLEWHYEGFDSIPYKLVVYSDWSGYRGFDSKDDSKVKQLYVSVNFPKSSTRIDVTAMINSIVESSIGLDGSEPMAPFPKPKTRVPAGFKKLIHE